MKRKEKLFGVLLGLVLMLALMAGLDAAAYAETSYPVWVGGTRVTSTNMNDVLRDGKVSFTPAEGSNPAILTLSGANITGSYNGAAIYAEVDLTIDVTADSTVTGPNDDFGNSYGVNADGAVTVNGTLTAAGGTATGKNDNSYGVYSVKSVTVNGTLTAAGAAATGKYGNSYGVCAFESVTVNGTLTAAGGAADGNSCGVNAEIGNVTVALGGTLTAEGGEAPKGDSNGVTVYNGDVTVAEGGKLTATGGTAFVDSIGVNVNVDNGNVTVALGGTLTAAGNTKAVNGRVRNAVDGTGWGNTAGTGSMAGIAVSEEGQSLSYRKVMFPAFVFYDVWVGGTQVTSANMDDVLRDGKVSYDPNNKTLTLNGAAITGSYNRAAIYAKDDLTIHVAADSTVTGPAEENSFGIHIRGDLAVSGTGTLTAAGAAATGNYGNSYGVYADKSVTVTGKLTAAGGDAYGNSYGVYADKSVTVNGTLTAAGGTADGNSCGVHAETGNVTVALGGTLTAEGGEAPKGDSTGVDVNNGNVTVNGTLTGTGGTSTNGSSFGVYVFKGGVTVNGTMTAEGGTAVNWSIGVNAYGAVTVNGALTAAGGTADCWSYGVSANGAVTVNGTLTATGGAANNSSYGVYALNTVTVNAGGTLTAAGKTQAVSGSVANAVAGTGWTDAAGTQGMAHIAVSEAGESLPFKKVRFPALYPVWVDGTQVTAANMDDVLGDADEGATVTFTPAEGSNPATLTLDGAAITGGYTFNENRVAAIYAEGDLTIDVTADSTVTGPDNDLGSSCGVYSGRSLTVTGSGELTAAGGTAGANCDSCGVYAYESVIVTGKLTATGREALNARSFGVYANNGNVTVNGTLTGTGGTSTNGSSCGVYANNGNVTVNGTLTGTVGTSTNGSSCGVYANNGTVTVDGTLTAEGGTADSSSCGIFASRYVTVDGTLTAEGGTSTYGDSCGVAAYEYVTVDGTLTAAGGAAAGTSIGVDVYNGNVTVAAGGTLTAEGGAAGGSSSGVKTSNGAVTVAEGGKLTAAGITQAVSGSVRNAVAGTGWTDAAGTAGMAYIAVNTTGQTLAYKKVQFPVPPFGTPDFTLPAAIRTIEAGAFEGAAMKIVSVPEGCAAIGANAFKDCAKLWQIRVPANCAIGDGAFSGCGTVYIYAPAGSPAESFCAAPANANCVFCEEA